MTGKMKRWVGLIFFLLVSVSVLGTVKEDQFDFVLRESDVLVTRETVFSDPESRVIDLGLPKDASQVGLWLDGKPARISNPLALNQVSKFKVVFATQDFLDQNDFFANMNALEPIDHLKVTLTLSEGFELKVPVDERLGSGSVYPKPSSITSDGQRIKIVWERKLFTPEDEFSILVVFKEKGGRWWWWTALLLVLLLGGFVVRLLGKEKSSSMQKSPDTVKKDMDISEHLKEEENQVIQILKNKEGSCEQGTIRFIGNFSKARLSRIISELETRNVVYKEIKGKKNVIHLKKDH